MGNPRGRPPRSSERADRRISFTVTASELASIYDLADDEHIDIADYCRLAILERAASRGKPISLPLTSAPFPEPINRKLAS